MLMCVCVRACMRACVHACVRACVRACVCGVCVCICMYVTMFQMSKDSASSAAMDKLTVSEQLLNLSMLALQNPGLLVALLADVSTLGFCSFLPVPASLPWWYWIQKYFLYLCDIRYQKLCSAKFVLTYIFNRRSPINDLLLKVFASVLVIISRYPVHLGSCTVVVFFTVPHVWHVLLWCGLCFSSPQHPPCHHTIAKRVKHFLELYHSVSESCVSRVKTPFNREVGEWVRGCEGWWEHHLV